MSIFHYLPIILILSFIQSFFGIGILVFGTPTLLFLGIPFDRALGLLLPCSIMINLLQLVTDFHFVSIKRKLFFGLVPFVILGLVFTLYSPIITHPKKIIGGLLLLSASIRFFKPILQITQKLLQKSLSISIPLVGFIHGLTNMGGGFLTVLISSLFHEKTLIRSHIAFGYFLMATSQLIVLGFIRPDSISWESGMSAIFSGLIYLVIGRKAFSSLANNSYQAALTAFIFFFGILMFF